MLRNRLSAAISAKYKKRSQPVEIWQVSRIMFSTEMQFLLESFSLSMLKTFNFCWKYTCKVQLLYGLPDGSAGKESTFNAGDTDVGSVPGLGRSPGEGNGNPLQYSCLENPMNRGAWQATVQRVTKRQT